MSFRTRYRRYGLGLLTVVLTAVPAAAAEQASYSGADREARLIAGAQKEGQLNLYAVMGLEQMQVIAAAFEKKYGLKVSIWRASSETTLRRVVTEARGGRFEVDLIETGAPELEALRREGLFMLSDAQALLPTLDITLALKKLMPAVNVPLKFVDPAAVLDENPKWQRLYDQIVVRQEPS